jgi:hypothetical protein
MFFAPAAKSLSKPAGKEVTYNKTKRSVTACSDESRTAVQEGGAKQGGRPSPRCGAGVDPVIEHYETLPMDLINEELRQAQIDARRTVDAVLRLIELRAREKTT